MIYSKDRSPDEETAKPNDKRYIYSRKLHSNTRAAASVDAGGLPRNGSSSLFQGGFLGRDRAVQSAGPAKIDWSFSLGAGFVAPGMYPAKFSFDINEPVTSANCTGTTEYVYPDFVVYGLNVAGVTGGQGNLVALDNLYSGTTPAVGVCGSGGPMVYWSYNTTTASGGKITTSPVLSEDGSQVAFLESGGATAYLHILNFNAGDGAGSGDAVHAAAPSTIWANASASATVSDTIQSVTVTNGGTGYTTAPTVAISGGGGTGATATSAISGGAATVAITAEGSNYASAPTVTFTGGGGTGAAGSANVTNGVTSYTVSAGGANYTSVPTITVAAPPSGNTATATATTTTGVTSINLTNGGTGYTAAPIVVYSGSGGGAATANLSQGVGSYTLTNGGSGYTSTPTVSISGDGTGATASATFSASVQSLNLTNAGSGYQTAPTVTFSPTGATATAAIAGPVSTLTLVTAGAGYTSAPTVTISAPTSGTTATATANMSTITSVSGVTFTNHGSYNTDFGFANPTVTFSCSATGCIQNTAATGTANTSTSSSTCGATQGFSDVCIASVTINNAGSYTLTGGSVVMTVNYYQKVTAAVYTVNTGTTTTLTSLTLNGGGSGYTSNPTVTFTGGGATTQATATAKINGTVQSLTLLTAGTYTSTPTVSFSSATGTGAAATATISGSVTAVNVTAVGTGYSTATVTINSASGTGAAATANLTGVVSSITVTTPGTYSSTPTITFNNSGTGGSGATATAALSKYVSAINVTYAGNNYAAAPTVTIGGPGTGAAATANLSGVVSSVTITTAGTGYTSAPAIAFGNSGTGGSGAAATSTINASVATVTVTNAGSGYTGAPTVTFGSGGGGTGAAATVNTLDQLSGITVVYGGSGYTSVPNVYITGGGTGASGATATANMSGGAVTSITLTSNGTGYTAAPTVTLDAPSATCSASASCMINVAIAKSHTITNSSPYYDYDNDVLYFGDDQGVLYSVSPVFVGTATNGGTAVPVVTSLQVASTSGQTILTGPVLDNNTGNVFVGAADGKVYAVPTPLSSGATTSMIVGEGTGSCSGGFNSGGIADPVMVDGSIGMFYAYTQNAATTISSSNRAVVTQASTGANSALFANRVNNITTGSGAFCGSNPATSGASVVNVHAPTFDNNYYNGTGTGHLFVCDNTTSGAPSMYAITFTGAGVMNNAVDPTLGVSFASLATSGYAECAPITEIFQPAADGGPDGTDYMLLGVGRIAGGTGAFGAAVGQAYGVTNSYVMTKGIEHSVNTYPPAQDGISGIVVDNISPVAQASSMYFTTEAVGTSADPVCGTGKYCAVKLTQSGLQ